ncbi:MAG TPA: GDSL-type esterase/lipase family protein [Acidimicrobiales bacterium]|nr:GDSL-type esterase/lipase family protein [Acidimicrobiales bacterium]
MARAPSRLVAAVVVAGLALVAAGCNPNDINTRLNQVGDDATASTLNGGAKGASVILGDGRVVFLANDVYAGTVNSNGTRSNNTRVANALMVAEGLESTDPVTTKLGSSNSAYLKPSTSGNSYSLLSAVAGGSDIQVFATERNSAGTRVAIKIVRLLQSTLAPSGTPVSVPIHAGGPEWGNHVLQRNGYWYIYGAGATASTYVARTPVGFLTSTGDWEYWTGSSWSGSESAAGPMRDWSGQVVDKYLTPATDNGNARMVFLGRDGGTTGNTFTFYASATAYGPVAVGSDVYTAPAESCGSGGSVYAFSLSSHPHLSDNEDNAIFSYARRCTVTNTQAAVDRPRFIALDLDDAPETPRWRPTWGTSLAPITSNYDFPNGFTAGTSLRQVVHTTRSGSTVRIRLSNVHGSSPLQIGAVTVGISGEQAGDTKTVTAAPTALTVGGQGGFTIPVGQTVHSDAITLPAALPGDHDVAITIYFTGNTTVIGGHVFNLETSHVGTGNHTGSISGSGLTTTTGNGYVLTALDVADPNLGGTVVALGDSLTDGYGSSVDGEARWTDVLHDLLVTAGTPVRSVTNVGVAGNHLLTGGSISGLGRFDADVARQPGVTTVVAWLGYNDILAGKSAAQLEVGLEDLVDKAHAAGLNIILGTITPLVGPNGNPNWNQELERLAINARIRQGALGADAYVDMAAVVQDPGNEARVRAAYSFLGGGHFNDAGYEAIADAVFAKRAFF